MRKAKFKRAGWFLDFMQAEISEETAGKWAKELASLLMAFDQSPADELDDQRVEFALSFSKSLFFDNADTDMCRTVERINPQLASFQKILQLQLQILLAGGEMKVDTRSRFRLKLQGALQGRGGGLSCPVVGAQEVEGQRFTFAIWCDENDLTSQVQLNFALAFASMPRFALGECQECRKFFVVERKGTLCCSPKCSAAHGMKAKRQNIREDPAEYEQYLEKERERSHQKHVKKVKAQTPGAKVTRRPRTSKKEE
jgi:hypothetical protein